MTMRNDRAEQPGEYGSQINTESVPFPTIANSTTTTVNLGLSPRLQWFRQGFIDQLILAASASALTVQIQKLDSTNGFAAVNLTAAQDITSSTQTAKKTFALAALTTLTDAQRTLNPGDALVAVFTAGGSVTSQAVGGIVGAELFILR